MYFYFSNGTMMNDMNVELYDSYGDTVGSQINLSGSALQVSRSLTNGQQYYLRVSNESNTGTYRIGFNTFETDKPQ